MMLLDEPTSGLAPTIIDEVFSLITRLPGLGVSALVIEQRARQSLEVSQRGYILDSGSIVMEGKATQLLADPRMASLYLGNAESRLA
jgi:ABC-type branched-subunit amino acid transport system ATPase component